MDRAPASGAGCDSSILSRRRNTVSGFKIQDSGFRIKDGGGEYEEKSSKCNW